MVGWWKGGIGKPKKTEGVVGALRLLLLSIWVCNLFQDWRFGYRLFCVGKKNCSIFADGREVGTKGSSGGR